MDFLYQDKRINMKSIQPIWLQEQKLWNAAIILRALQMWNWLRTQSEDIGRLKWNCTGIWIIPLEKMGIRRWTKLLSRIIAYSIFLEYRRTSYTFVKYLWWWNNFKSIRILKSGNKVESPNQKQKELKPHKKQANIDREYLLESKTEQRIRRCRQAGSGKICLSWKIEKNAFSIL